MDAINSNTKRSYRYRQKWGAGGKKAFEKGDRSGGQEAFIDLFNRLAAQYGAAVTDFMVGNSVTPFAFFRTVTLIQDDLDLWFEATGQRVSQFIGAERQALECWLWETHDRRRQPDRFKPNKSPDHDALWPGAPTNWAPRRWFCWKPPSWLPGAKLLSISTAGALDKECHPENLVPEDLAIRDCAEALVGWGRRSGPITRGQLATEITGETFRRTKSGERESETSRECVSERTHPKPQGFWDIRWDGSQQRLDWRDKKWEACDDVPSEREPLSEKVLLDGWAREHVGTVANALSEKRKECERRREAAICGLLSNFGCV